ncbi:MAG: RNA polymerase sigma factor RpoE [Gammaproteobacteria bacterium]|nr:MAG: RNA polymerase sigma factor RpoE [Gammaproteobacteria bacterium]
MTEKNRDMQLVEKAKNGDRRAFDILVLKYQGKICNIISRFVRNPDDVTEIAQETFIKAYRSLESFRGDSAFYTWIYRIAVNTAKNFLVAMSRRPQNSGIDVQEAEQFSSGGGLRENTTPEKIISRNELEETIKKALDELPEDLRSAITLREMEGLSYEDIAAVMDCPVGTVRSRIFRAREAVDQKLRPLLEPVD